MDKYYAFILEEPVITMHQEKPHLLIYSYKLGYVRVCE